MSFATTIESNIDEVIREAESRMPSGEEHEGEVINPSDYARYLQDRMGYWVLNDSVLERFWHEEHAEAAEEAGQRGEILSDADVGRAAARALRRTVEHYQSVIGQKGSRGRAMLPPRPMHPGNWADDTITLVKAYVTYLKRAGRVIDFSKYDDYQNT